MGRVVWMMSISLDGYMEGPDHDLSWHLVDDELHRHFNEYLAGAGAFLGGRVTYELMAAYWPTADHDPDISEPEREFAGIWREKPQVVFSRTLEQVGPNTTILRSVEPAQIESMKREIEGDLVVGGADLGATFRRLDLIDEHRIYVHPVLVGEGTLAFPPTGERQSMRLVEHRTFGSGVVLLRYARVRS
jgi:dihydrofolate reductase